MKKVFFVLSCLLITGIIGYSQNSITLGPRAVGLILVDGKIFGSAFVLHKPNYVVTCSHVLKGNTKAQYLPVNGKKRHELKVFVNDSIHDVALLISDDNITSKPFRAEELWQTNTKGQHLFYCGFNSEDSTPESTVMKFHNAYVDSIGTSGSINFIDFVGDGIPGYSGGPVINDHGRVVAVMTLRISKKVGNVEIVPATNRVFSILPLVKYLK